MRRVLEVFGEPIAVGGQEAYVIGHVTAMDLNGLQVDCLTPYACESDAQRKRIETWGGTVFELGLPFAPGRSRELIRKPLRSFFGEHRYDVVHIHSGSTSVLSIASEEAKRSGAGLVIAHSHAAVESMGIKQKLVRLVSSKGISKADILCACSEKAAEAKFLPSKLNKVRILKNGIDVKRYLYARDMRKKTRGLLNVAEGTIVVGNVGRLAFQKNQKRLLSIFSSYHNQYIDSQLWLIGDGPDRKELGTEAKVLGIDDCVRFFGNREDVPALLSCMDAFVFPSLFEGLSIALLEAQAADVPCLASDSIPGDAEIVTGSIQWMSLDRDNDAWVNALRHILATRSPNSPQSIIDAFDGNGYSIVASSAELRRLYLG